MNDLRDVLDELAEDEEFWARQGRGLAVFATPAGARAVQVANRVAPMVEVSDRFHVKPLLRSATFPQAACDDIPGDGPAAAILRYPV